MSELEALKGIGDAICILFIVAGIVGTVIAGALVSCADSLEEIEKKLTARL